MIEANVEANVKAKVEAEAEAYVKSELEAEPEAEAEPELEAEPEAEEEELSDEPIVYLDDMGAQVTTESHIEPMNLVDSKMTFLDQNEDDAMEETIEILHESNEYMLIEGLDFVEQNNCLEEENDDYFNSTLNDNHDHLLLHEMEENNETDEMNEVVDELNFDDDLIEDDEEDGEVLEDIDLTNDTEDVNQVLLRVIGEEPVVTRDVLNITDEGILYY